MPRKKKVILVPGSLAESHHRCQEIVHRYSAEMHEECRKKDQLKKEILEAVPIDCFKKLLGLVIDELFVGGETTRYFMPSEIVMLRDVFKKLEGVISMVSSDIRTQERIMVRFTVCERPDPAVAGT